MYPQLLSIYIYYLYDKKQVFSIQTSWLTPTISTPTPTPDTTQVQKHTKLETSPQDILLVGIVNKMQACSLTSAPVQYSQRRSDGRQKYP